jgi:hypothetical protein
LYLYMPNADRTKIIINNSIPNNILCVLFNFIVPPIDIYSINHTKFLYKYYI